MKQRLYTYVPITNTVDIDGLLSTRLSPAGWEKYKGRAKKKFLADGGGWRTEDDWNNYRKSGGGWMGAEV